MIPMRAACSAEAASSATGFTTALPFRAKRAPMASLENGSAARP
jgi:hypothetical protein